MRDSIPIEGSRYAEGYTCEFSSFDDMVCEFVVKTPDDDVLRVMACIADGWEHVGVKVTDSPLYNHFLPTWDHMAAVKDLFWDYDECVVQFHPPADRYVNKDAGVLHLWKHTKYEFPVPDPSLV